MNLSPPAERDASPEPSADCRSDASPEVLGDGLRICAWCRDRFEPTRSDAVFCKVRCRQAAWRIRRRRLAGVGDGSPKRMAYADPPYPGFAKRLYGTEPTYAGEVDHAKLIASLVDQYDGWALSTGAYALRDLLPLCPPEARVCAWVKPIGVSGKTFGLHNCWEPIIVVPGRQLQPGKRDWFAAQPARGGGTLMGRKPIAFAAFLFDALGLLPIDELDDLFPGTGIIGRAWRYFSDKRLTGPSATPGGASHV